MHAYHIDPYRQPTYLTVMVQMKSTLGFVLHDVARLQRKRFEQRARSLGLTRSQWQVLAHVAVKPGIQQSVLAEHLEIEPITLCRILDRLEASSMLERRRHATDRRIWQLHLTDQAEPLLTEMSNFADLTREEALAGVNKSDQDLLIATLTLMRANLIEACTQPAHPTAQPERAESHG